MAAGNISSQPDPWPCWLVQGTPGLLSLEARGLSSLSVTSWNSPPAEGEAYLPPNFWESHSHTPILAAKSYGYWGTGKGKWLGPQ